MNLRLRPLTLEDEVDARAAHAELARDLFKFLLDWDPADAWPAYLERLSERRRGLDLPADRVPATFLVAQLGDEIVGRASIRHTLNDHLAAVGGHIGYGVRPGFRGRGIASEILRQALVVARSEGVERVLLICEDDNPASAAVIERAGGHLEAIRVDADGKRLRRYWIT
jgi:predicted acetyltransferase